MAKDVNDVLPRHVLYQQLQEELVELAECALGEFRSEACIESGEIFKLLKGINHFHEECSDVCLCAGYLFGIGVVRDSVAGQVRMLRNINATSTFLAITFAAIRASEIASKMARLECGENLPKVDSYSSDDIETYALVKSGELFDLVVSVLAACEMRGFCVLDGMVENKRERWKSRLSESRGIDFEEE